MSKSSNGGVPKTQNTEDKEKNIIERTKEARETAHKLNKKKQRYLERERYLKENEKLINEKTKEIIKKTKEQRYSQTRKEIIEDIDTLVAKRDIVVIKYQKATSNLISFGLLHKKKEAQIESTKAKKYIENLIKLEKDILSIMNYFSWYVSRIHFWLYIIHRYFCISTKLYNTQEDEMGVIDIPISFIVLKKHHKMYSKECIETLEKLFYKGMKMFNEMAFIESYMYQSDGTIFFSDYWEKLKSAMNEEIIIDIEKVAEPIYNYFYKGQIEGGRSIIGLGPMEVLGQINEELEKYIKNISDVYSNISIEVNEIGTDNQKYRPYAIREGLHCGYGSETV